MGATEMQYTTVLIVDRRTIVLRECACCDDERTLELQIDGALKGELRLLAHLFPRFAIGASHVAIWGGTRIYLVPWDGGAVRRFDQEEEIIAAYPVASRWCLVNETSVVLFQPSDFSEVGRFENDEVLLRSYWTPEGLVVEDFQRRRLLFSSLDTTPELKPDQI